MSKVYDQATRRNLKEIRALRVGDVLRVYRQDSEVTFDCFVTHCSTTSKTGDEWNVMVLTLSSFGKRWSESRRLATDRFEVIGKLSVASLGVTVSANKAVSRGMLSSMFQVDDAGHIPKSAKMKEPGKQSVQTNIRREGHYSESGKQPKFVMSKETKTSRVPSAKPQQPNTPKPAKPSWSNAQVNAAFEKAGKPTSTKAKK
jgi:hypothetical protein